MAGGMIAKRWTVPKKGLLDHAKPERGFAEHYGSRLY